MKKNLNTLLVCMAGLLLPQTKSTAQITLLQDYKNNRSAAIGTFQGINFREAGFSGMYAIPNTNGKEFWVCSDRGVNVDAANANPTGCAPTYDKIYAFQNYAPKIHRIRLNGDSIQILQTITMKRPGGAPASGVINPTGFGSTSAEIASTDTVLDCSRFGLKTAPKDVWGIDAEGIVVDRDGFFWICEEGGPTVWKLNANGVVVKRYTPYANLVGAESIDVQIDTVFKYRKNNRGFEGISITPSGKIYAIIQSPILNPTKSVGENTRVHRILEINPATDATRMFTYLNDGIIGTGSNQIRLRDWKIGDMAAINDTTFLVMEAALRGTTDIKRIYKININGATPVTSGLYGGVSLEALVDSTGLATNGIVPVKKTLFMDLLANGWNPLLDKAEGLAILNDSTIFVGNDNDYGQFSPAENGIATATTNVSHVVKYGLKGSNKLSNYSFVPPSLMSGVTGPSTAQTPYLTPTTAGGKFTSILTSTEVVGGYKMCGLPDGMGAYDNNDGTFTVLMNHEMGNAAGVTRAHGSTGAFVSKWVIRKSDLSVVSGSDLIRNINLWDTATSTYTTYNSSVPSSLAAINRLCSADLPPVSAFYNSATGKGTQERIFMNGEEAGAEGRAFGHIATGANAGTTYELPYLGKFSWENSVASPISSDTTVVIGTDDATPGQVYVYVGTKTNTGSEVDKAGLNNGRVFGVTVAGLTTETSLSVPAPGTAFSLTDMGDVHNTTGATLNTASNTAGVTAFLRPEDGAWDPSSPNDFYFVTTNSFTSPSRLWRLRFTNAANPTLGGTITALLDGTEGPKMMDNMTIDNYGHVLIQEDPGGNSYLAKMWQYDIATDALMQIGSQDSTRFLSGGANFLTIDEESSGIIDMEKILGPGMFLAADQAHYAISGEAVEGGQLLAFFNPDTYNAAPEVNVKGNSLDIADGDVTPSSGDNTNFGSVFTGSTVTKTFVIHSTGAAALTVSGISFSGTHAGDFTLVGAPTFPLTIASGSSQSITVRFAPLAAGSKSATIRIANKDIDESIYDFALTGNSVDSPEINVQGNRVNITDGDATPGTINNTDFGSTTIGTSVNKTFVIQNKGFSALSVSGIAFTGAHSGEFTLVSAPSFPLSVAVADSYTVTVRFSPTAAGTRSATLTINSNDADEAAYDFGIQGNGTALPEINVKGNNLNITDGDPTAGPSNNTDLGDAIIGSTQRKPFIIQNTGKGALVISGVSITGADAGAFTLYGSPVFPFTIAGNDSALLNVQFAPLVAGKHNATFAILSNDADEAMYDFAIEGNGVGLPEINMTGNGNVIFDGDVTPGSANNTHMGSVAVGNSVSRNFVIENRGAGTLKVAEISISGDNATDFTMPGAPSLPFTVAADASQSIIVQFLPKATGTRTATLTIVSNDGDESTYNFLIEGNGLNTTGVTSLSASTSMKVYPNPTRDEATVAVSLEKESRISVNVTDLQGREVLPATDKIYGTGEHFIRLNTADLSNGIYFLKIADGTSTANVKIVVMH